MIIPDISAIGRYLSRYPEGVLYKCSIMLHYTLAFLERLSDD